MTVGFEQSTYTFYESREETTPQICVSVSTVSPDIDAVLEITITPDTARGILMWFLFKICSYSMVLRDFWDINKTST